MKRAVILFHIPFALFAFVVRAQEIPPFPPPPDDVSSATILATPAEPGERLSIHGTVFHADGVTPYKDLVLYLYQTDASGIYNHVTGSWREPRLHGWVKTNDRGGYSIQTIKPGSYPRGRNPAHIHAILKLPNKSPVWIEDFLFEGDPFLTDQQRQGSTKKTSFGNIITLTRNGAGILTGVRDILIDE